MLIVIATMTAPNRTRNHRALLQLSCGLIAWRLAIAEDLPG
jgi:hypothetical protein